jgi:hypothetical protein
MTATARLVLLDCEAALEDLRAGPTGLQWRTRWAAVVALLRSVGHVLQKVDAKSSRAMGQAIREAFADLKATAPEPRIFWTFIEEERNNILKEYRSSAKQNVTVRPGTTGADTPHTAGRGHHTSGIVQSRPAPFGEPAVQQRAVKRRLVRALA